MRSGWIQILASVLNFGSARGVHSLQLRANLNGSDNTIWSMQPESQHVASLNDSYNYGFHLSKVPLCILFYGSQTWQLSWDQGGHKTKRRLRTDAKQRTIICIRLSSVDMED
jgi:hypothetical protein